MEPKKPDTLINADFADLELRVAAHLDYMHTGITPTGRTPQPFNPEPHSLPRRKGHTLALVVGPLNLPLRWINTVMLKSLMFDAQVQIDGEDIGLPPFCPVRFLPFYDIHAFDRGRKS